MLKGICLALGLFIGWPIGAQAMHVIPTEGQEVVVGNFCYDTSKYFEEVNKLNKEQGLKVAKKRYWEIMSDKDAPCYAGRQIPGRLGTMLSEEKNLIGNGNQCFHSQIWEILPLSGESDRRIYTVWHVRCSDLKEA